MGDLTCLSIMTAVCPASAGAILEPSASCPWQAEQPVEMNSWCLSSAASWWSVGVGVAVGSGVGVDAGTSVGVGVLPLEISQPVKLKPSTRNAVRLINGIVNNSFIKVF